MKKYILAVIVLFSATLVWAQPLDRTKKPEPTEAMPIRIGEYKTFVAENGMTVFVVRKAGYPKFRISFKFKTPNIYQETQVEESDILKAFFEKGNGILTNEQIKEKAEAKGGEVSTMGLVVTGMKENADDLVSLLGSCMMYDKYKDADLLKIKSEMIEKLRNEQPKSTREVDFMAKLKDSLAFTKSTMGTSRKPTLERLQNITLKDVKAYKSKYYNPANCFCMVLGDFTQDEINAMFRKTMKGWKGGNQHSQSDMTDRYTCQYPTERRIYVVDQPLAVQSNIIMMWPMDDAFPYAQNEALIKVMAQIFGENYNSYLNKNLRLDKGLCYFVKCFTNININGGYNSVNTKVRNDQTDYAIENILYEMYRIRNQRVSDEDLNMAKNGLLGDYALSMSALNSPSIIGFGMVKEEFKLPDNYLETYPEKISKITAEDIRIAARKYIDPFAFNIFIEGKADELRGKLEKFGQVEYYDKTGKRLFVND